MEAANSLNHLIEGLDEVPGISGYEDEIADYIKQELEPYTDSNYRDALGNQIFVREGLNPDLKLMISAHMDEIGFMVSYIDENGFVFMVPVGLHDERMIMNQVLSIHTEEGSVKGVTGCKPSHSLACTDADKPIPLTQIYIDIGTATREETEKLGVKVGDAITVDRKGQFLNGRVFTGKAVDNRAGCAVMIEVMKRLKDKAVQPTVYAVASVQEEVGIRGAGPAAEGIKPDVAVALDVTFAGGTPDLCPRSISIFQGKGPAVKFYDWCPKSSFIGNSVPKRLTKRFIDTAEKNGIPYQREVLLNGGTDGWAISLCGTGILTGCLSIPVRYVHTAVSCVLMEDLENTVRLLLGFIEDLTEKI